MSGTFLQVEGLETVFSVSYGSAWRRRIGSIRAVDGVSFTMKRGEALGLVGESGCGKSSLARTIMGLVPAAGGRILLDGREMSGTASAQSGTHPADVQMIFQDPSASLDPRMTVFDTLAEALNARGSVGRSELTARVSELMERVGLSPMQMKKYPHEFSGGQCQRIAVARALAPEPKLLIADEPVSALDVSIQSQIINLIKGLSGELGLSLIFISHDLSVVRHIAHRTGVMYLGRLVEIGTSTGVMDSPLHPYSEALVSAIPEPDPDRERERKRIILRGEPPSLLDPPGGCPFHPRCPKADELCRRTVPEMEETPDGRRVACLQAKV